MSDLLTLLNIGFGVKLSAEQAKILADLLEQQAAEINALKAHVERLREVWQSQGGCGAHMCCMKKPEGIGNNGGCRCYENRSMMHMVTQHMNAVFQQTPQQSLAKHDAEVITNLKFPTMLRKMWSGGEVQDWLNQEAQRIKDGE